MWIWEWFLRDLARDKRARSNAELTEQVLAQATQTMKIAKRIARKREQESLERDLLRINGLLRQNNDRSKYT